MENASRPSAESFNFTYSKIKLKYDCLKASFLPCVALQQSQYLQTRHAFEMWMRLLVVQSE